MGDDAADQIREVGVRSNQGQARRIGDDPAPTRCPAYACLPEFESDTPDLRVRLLGAFRGCYPTRQQRAAMIGPCPVRSFSSTTTRLSRACAAHARRQRARGRWGGRHRGGGLRPRATLRPTAALVDVGLPDGDGIALAARAHRAAVAPRMVLTSTDPDAASPEDVRALAARAASSQGMTCRRRLVELLASASDREPVGYGSAVSVAGACGAR